VLAGFARGELPAAQVPGTEARLENDGARPRATHVMTWGREGELRVYTVSVTLR
jgi:hypothetical protein